jgi:hypothetical protein
MLGERLADGTAAFESGDRGLRRKSVSLGTIFPKVCRETLELELELLDRPFGIIPNRLKRNGFLTYFVALSCMIW